jgi:hypothetical protein
VRRYTFIPLLAALVLGGCGTSAPPAPAKKAEAPKTVAKPSDESRRFPSQNQVKMELVEQKMLGRDFLPGGNLAQYKRGNKTYQQFLIRASDANRAAILLLDLKNTLRDTKFIAHMGGIYGLDGDTPVYCFAKGVFLAGLIGLPEKEADPLAREFAARL